MTINAPAPVLVAMYVVAAERQGVPAATVRARRRTTCSRSTSRAAPTSTRRGRRCGWRPTSIAWCARRGAAASTRSRSRGYHIREAGSTAVQEMAFAFANAIAYVEAVLARGVAVDDFAPRLSWIFNTHTNFFEEIAKYRALRRMWATLMRERFGAHRPALADAAHAHADGRLDADRAAAREQHRARGAAGARRGARRRAVAGALLLRRGARDPDRERAAHRGAHAADHRRGDRRDRHRRPARRLVLRRVR